MADSSLDDFFAKKDKSKKKSKAKMTPGDVLAKSEEPKKVKKKKEKEQPGGLGLNVTEDTTKKAEDDEWEDFQEQKEVDYTGLRIGTLQVQAKEEEEKKEAAESDGEGEGGDREEGRDSASGPWNATAVPTTTPAPVAVAAPAPEVEEKKESSAPKKYVPPGARAAAQSGASGPSNPISRRAANKKAPNIQSEVDFPTLGGGGPSSTASSTSAWGGRRYEDSGAGDIESNPGGRRGVNLSLENKFAALQD